MYVAFFEVCLQELVDNWFDRYQSYEGSVLVAYPRIVHTLEWQSHHGIHRKAWIVALYLVEDAHRRVIVAIDLGIPELADLIRQLQDFEGRCISIAIVCAVLCKLCSSCSWIFILTVIVFVALLAVGTG